MQPFTSASRRNRHDPHGFGAGFAVAVFCLALIAPDAALHAHATHGKCDSANVADGGCAESNDFAIGPAGSASGQPVSDEGRLASGLCLACAQSGGKSHAVTSTAVAEIAAIAAHARRPADATVRRSITRTHVGPRAPPAA